MGTIWSFTFDVASKIEVHELQVQGVQRITMQNYIFHILRWNNSTFRWEYKYTRIGSCCIPYCYSSHWPRQNRRPEAHASINRNQNWNHFIDQIAAEQQNLLETLRWSAQQILSWFFRGRSPHIILQALIIVHNNTIHAKNVWCWQKKCG